jgi:hypothetical protein
MHLAHLAGTIGLDFRSQRPAGSSSSAVFSAFPRRPVQVLRTGMARASRLVMGTLLFLAIGAGIAIWLGPGVLRDLQIQEDPVLVESARVTDARCRTKLIIVVCRAKLDYSVDGRSYTASPDFYFFDVPSERYDIRVLRSAEHPDRATLTLGLDRLGSRIAFLAILLALCVAPLVDAVPQVVQGIRLTRGTRRSPLVPIAVKVLRVSRGWRGAVGIQYAYEHAGRRRKAAASFESCEKPFFCDRGLVLAAVGADGSRPVLLDESLTRLSLTDAERHALYAARQAGQAG